ncbi:DUF4249 domain-containing protein [Parabacteroides pacaensis]|uniref:DUF4249 domain-containing protein n=1 Tax=Parabacteroides pacaensis TaxID=2086575 RepID=UPI000D10EE46|nr:DUF4249 domain-containing protein [Parabacteroides pacaensis]
MNVKLFIGSLVMMFYLGSCTSEIEVHFDKIPEKIVLNAILHPDSLITAHVSHSIQVGEDISTSYLNDAVVEVSINGIPQGRMERAEDNGFYRLPGMFPKAGDRIRMDVSSPEYEAASSEVVFPGKVDILSVDTTSNVHLSDWLTRDIRLQVRFKDPPAEKNYYLLAIIPETIEIEGGKESSYSSYVSVNLKEEIIFENNRQTPEGWDYSESSNRGIFRDEQISGQEYTLKVTVERCSYSTETERGSITNKLKIRLYSVSDSFYRYQLSYMRKEDADNNFGNSGLKEPVQLYSNIENGYGLFTGIQMSEYEIVLPFQGN